ncbi:MAG TPA: RNA-binding S4 domain-containing protein [Steroidobacteraceae bacterium]|nr:RNA-binding S4 domain-containing protein [Steroidobacteraceae bacterium]
MDRSDDAAPGSARIDRWLFAVRLFKSRSAAGEAVNGGRVHLNGARIKPSRAVKPGDTVSFTRGAVLFECTVAAVPPRRGPASDAVGCYDELPESRTRREQYVTRRRMAAGGASLSQDRPDKHGRRLLRQLRGRG